MVLTHEHIEPLTALDIKTSEEKILASGLLSRPEMTLIDERMEKVLAESIFDDDPVSVNEELQLAIKVGFYGKAIDGAEEIYKEGSKIYTDSLLNRGEAIPEQIPNIAATSAFTRLRQIGTGLRDEQYLLLQQMVIKEASHEVLMALDLNPSDIDLVLNATSIPVQENFHTFWAAAAGININENPPELIRLCMACDSSAHGVALTLAGHFDHYLHTHNPELKKGKPANIMLLALDDANRLSDRGGDPFSPQLFSTGFGILVFTYHPDKQRPNTFKTVVHVHQSIEDGTKYLKVPRPYDQWQNKTNLYTAEHLKTPDHDGPIEMHPRAGAIFKRYALRVSREALGQYLEKGYNFQDIKRVIIHHPSGEVFKDVKEEMIKDGFREDQIAWVIPEGNVPVGTYPIGLSRQLGPVETSEAFGRQLEPLQPGDHVLKIFFGAGGEYDVSIVELGKAT